VFVRRMLMLLVLLSSLAALGCSDYRVRFLYPRENRGDFFSERPEYALYVAEPEDLRPSVERQGRGFIHTLHFPADDKLDQPAVQIVRRALLQDLGQTRVASLVQNPNNADYVLDSELLSMTTGTTNGYDDDVMGWDFAFDDPDPDPYIYHAKNMNKIAPNWHSIPAMGIIGARGNNGRGIAGINWEVSMMLLKCGAQGDTGRFRVERVAEAIRYAVDNGARVINWSGFVSEKDPEKLQVLQEV